MTTGDLLSQALRETGDPPLRPLPGRAAELLRDLQAPPRLAAHLRAVHDVALQLVDWVTQRYPALRLDGDAVLFGAATHDIGKTAHIAELSGPGSAHEQAGRQLLLNQGITPELARFAATHAAWTGPGVTLEDLLVSVADKIWKNKRVPDLEDLVITRLAAASGRTHWEEFLAFDDILTFIGNGADQRLAFQSSYPVHKKLGASARARTVTLVQGDTGGTGRTPAGRRKSPAAVAPGLPHSPRCSSPIPDVIAGLCAVETAGSPAAVAESGGLSRTGTGRSGQASRGVRCRCRRCGRRA